MKVKKISFIINVLLVIVIIFVINDKKENVRALSNDQETGYEFKDYPLLDIPINNNESDVMLMIANDVIRPDKTNYLFTKDKENLKEMQSMFSVNSFPVDQDTTADSIAFIFQNNVLIKKVPFLGTYNDNDNLSYLHKSEAEELIEQQPYAVSDYPLLDMPLRYNQWEVILVVVNNVMNPNEVEYLYTDDKKILEDMQTVFNVTSFPVDRGTTPDSMVYIYQDGILIKKIPFWGTYHDNQFNLISLNQQELEKKLKQKLPPAI